MFNIPRPEDAEIDQEAWFENLQAKLGHPGMDERPLSSAIDAEASDNELHERLRLNKVTNPAMLKDQEQALKIDARFANVDRFETPLGPVNIIHIAPAKEALQLPTQEEFITGSKVELVLENNATIVEKRTVDGVDLTVHARTLRINDVNLTSLDGLALQDVLTLSPLVAKHFGAMVINNTTDVDGHILLTIGKGEARAADEAILPPEATTPMTQAIFDRLTPYDRQQFAAALRQPGIFDGRIGAGIVRKIGEPGNIEITHIDPETLTQLKERNGTEYSIVLAQALDSAVINQLTDLPVRQIAEMDDWMLDIYGDKTIKLALNNAGACTLTLN